MKFSGAQRRMLDVMRADPDGKIHSGSGANFKRTTAEALERMGLASVSKTMTERTVRRRNGTTDRRVVVEWSARLKPVLPGQGQLSELDLILERGEKTLLPGQREHAAAYVAVVSPLVAKDGAPCKSPDYDASTAYVTHLALETTRLLAAYMVVRSMSGQVTLGPSPHESRGEPTETWVIVAPGTPQAPGKELARVRGALEIDGKYAANSLLNRRGGYDMRRLGTKETDPAWIKDFRAGNRVLRLASDAEGEYVVTDVQTTEVMVIRNSATEAERDARADVESLLSALI